MASPTAQRRSVVIDLVSDDSDEDVQELPGPARQQSQLHTPHAPQQPAVAAQNFAMDDFIDLDGDLPGAFPHDPLSPPAPTPAPQPANDRVDGEYLIIDGEQIFIPNSPGFPPRPASPLNQQQHGHEEVAAQFPREQTFTADDCLQHVLAIFPDVSHEHVHQLYQDIEAVIPGPERTENIVNKLLSAESYPKRDKGKQKKRKRDDEEEEEEAERKRWEGPGRDAEPNHLKGTVSSMLKAEFPEATHNLIAELMQTHRHLYQTYIALAKSRDGNDTSGWRGRAPKGRLADADTIAANSGWDALSHELKAARKQVERIRADRRADDAKKKAEQENLQRAIEAGETAECQACFEDLPMNRQIHCNGDVAHFTCFDCAETYIKSEVGDSRARVQCTAGCGSGFAHAQLHRLADKQLLEKLEQLQQEKDIRDAGLDDLEECPFCDYKAILPPVEEDFEFRCMNPLCEKVSCRRCKSISHIPQSCEEYAKDNKLNTRHKIEEAMTAAMIRSCNKCKKQFIKEYGCNKMSCPSCGNLQCYVCSESLKSYDHFDQAAGYGGAPTVNRKKCPLYDNVEERHEREVKEAEAAARAAAMSENPDVSEKDLEIKVSDAVQKATRDRIQRGAVGPGGIPAPADYAGLFARVPRLGHLFEDDGANGDEDFEDDEDLLADDFFDMQPRRRRNPAAARARVARLANMIGGDHQRLQPPPNPRQAQYPPRPADPRLHRQLAVPPAPAPAAAAIRAPLNYGPPRMQGFIPVFGFGLRPAVQPALVPPALANPPPVQPQQQAQPPAAPVGAGDRIWGRLQNPFGANAFAYNPPDNAPGFPGQLDQVEQNRLRRRRYILDLAQRQQAHRDQRFQRGPAAG